MRVRDKLPELWRAFGVNGRKVPAEVFLRRETGVPSTEAMSHIYLQIVAVEQLNGCSRTVSQKKGRGLRVKKGLLDCPVENRTATHREELPVVRHTFSPLHH